MSFTDIILCPECEASIIVNDVEKGEFVQCPDCGVELEVLSTEPIKLGPAPDEGENWNLS